MTIFKKAKLIGVLFKKTLNEKIDYELFLRCSAIIDKAFLPDLKKLPEYKIPIGNQEISAPLYGLGLLIKTSSFNNINDIEQDSYKLSKLGKSLCDLIYDEF